MTSQQIPEALEGAPTFEELMTEYASASDTAAEKTTNTYIDQAKAVGRKLFTENPNLDTEQAYQAISKKTLVYAVEGSMEYGRLQTEAATSIAAELLANNPEINSSNLLNEVLKIKAMIPKADIANTQLMVRWIWEHK